MTTISWFLAIAVTFAAMMLERGFGKFTWLFVGLVCVYVWDWTNAGES